MNAPDDSRPGSRPADDAGDRVGVTPKGHHDERQMWWWLGYFLFGIHIVALVMIYAVTHAPE